MALKLFAIKSVWLWNCSDLTQFGIEKVWIWNSLALKLFGFGTVWFWNSLASKLSGFVTVWHQKCFASKLFGFETVCHQNCLALKPIIRDIYGVDYSEKKRVKNLVTLFLDERNRTQESNSSVPQHCNWYANKVSTWVALKNELCAIFNTTVCTLYSVQYMIWPKKLKNK